MNSSFSSEHIIRAPQRAVGAFHHSPEAIRHLSPPLIPLQLHYAEPLEEESITEFTLWFGPIPIRWKARHINVGKYGFTDVQLSGAFKRWEHSHRYVPATRHTTLVEDHIEFTHHRGLRGLLTRLLFSRFSLSVLFAYRRFAMEVGARAWAEPGDPETEASIVRLPAWKISGED